MFSSCFFFNIFENRRLIEFIFLFSDQLSIGFINNAFDYGLSLPDMEICVPRIAGMLNEMLHRNSNVSENAYVPTQPGTIPTVAAENTEDVKAPMRPVIGESVATISGSMGESTSFVSSYVKASSSPSYAVAASTNCGRPHSQPLTRTENVASTSAAMCTKSQFDGPSTSVKAVSFSTFCQRQSASIDTVPADEASHELAMLGQAAAVDDGHMATSLLTEMVQPRRSIRERRKSELFNTAPTTPRRPTPRKPRRPTPQKVSIAVWLILFTRCTIDFYSKNFLYSVETTQNFKLCLNLLSYHI